MKSNKLLPISFLIVLVVTLTPGNGKIVGNYLDKIVHFAIFFFLAINLLYSYQNSSKLFLYLFLAILLGGLTEILQNYIPGRNMDWVDASADTLGVVFAFLLFQWNAQKVEQILRKLGA